MSNLKQFIWYERYRPQILGDMILSAEYKLLFGGYVEQGQFPHLLLLGPPGSGKTTMALILIRATNAIALMLNASSQDRGIETIRGKVKQFASSQALDGKLKVVFLDESDGLSRDAMEALRNTIETYSDTCRFILTANYGDRISSPLKSRCKVLAFDTISKVDLLNDLQWMLGEERITFQSEDIVELIERYYPDVRTIINNLQAGSAGGTFNPAVAGMAMNVDLDALADRLKKGKIIQARQLYVGCSDFVWLYRWLFDSWVAIQFLDEHRTTAALIVAQYLYQDSTVLDREINFTACLLDLCREGGTHIDWR